MRKMSYFGMEENVIIVVVEPEVSEVPGLNASLSGSLSETEQN